MLKDIQDLGHLIEKKYDQRNFSSICLDHLNNFKAEEDISVLEKELCKWMLGSIPKQLNVYDGFGQPPITVFNNGQFVIDLYFWTNSDTTIHSHSFSGAFRILFGASQQESYSIKTKNKVSEDVHITNVIQESTQIMRVGDTQEITPGNSFCHRVIHLEKPTVTLCIRTLNDFDNPQWHHFENGLSLLKKELSEGVYKKLSYFQYLLHKDHTQGFSYLNELLLGITRSETINVFEQLTIDGMGLEEETIECIHNTILSKFHGQKWFILYEEFCVSVQN